MIIETRGASELFGSIIRIAEPYNLLVSYLVHQSGQAIAIDVELINFGLINFYQLRDAINDSNPYLLASLDKSITLAHKLKFTTYLELIEEKLLSIK